MAAPHTPREIGSELGGRYRLVAPVGVGVSSKVFLAVDSQLRRRVAVKVLHDALTEDQVFLSRFREEARRAAALSHPNILAVYDWGEDRDGDAVVPYLVTEYLAGGSLRSILDTGALLSSSQALMVGLETARALAHAHERGLVHRDVKPANLLFDDAGHVRLADFGLAKALAEASWTEPAGSSVGTVRYASPEQVLGQRLDGRSDVYSLALVLCEAVSGSVPLLADSAAGTMGLRTQQEVDIPMGFGRLRSPLLRAAARDPEARSDAGELEIGLMAAATEMPRPEPLDLVPTLGAGDRTSELHLSDPMAGLAILGAMGAHDTGPRPTGPGHPGPGHPDPHGTDVGDVGATSGATPGAGDTSDIDGAANGESGDIAAPLLAAGRGEPSWALQDQRQDLRRDPIVVASEHDALALSRPGSHGRVEPLRDPGLPRALDGAPAHRPRRSRRVLAAAVVLVVLAGAGAGWWFLVRTPTHEVPAWSGEQIETVQAEARDNGWKIDDDELVRRDGTRVGQVVDQQPPAGTPLAEGSTVTLTVSLGPTLVPFPQVVGTPEAEAVVALESAGLVVGERSTAFDESVPAGSIVSATPAAEYEGVDAQGMIAKETPVELVVSDGPAPRVVPDGLVGATRADAEAKLAAVQLKAGVQEQYDEAVPTGVVISAGTAPGTEVPRDSEVALVVSLGPAPVPIPDVTGQSGSAAAATLEGAGFVVSGTEGSPNGTVLATDPPAGEAHLRGTAVRIFTRR